MHIMQYDESLIDHYDSGKRISDYYSLRYSEYFHLDIDAEGHEEEAKTSLISFLEFLFTEYDVDMNWVEKYWSGSKGFHISIPTILFNITPHSRLESKMRLLTSKLTEGHKLAEFADDRLYCRNRMLRIPNSINPKSNLYKILITWNELNNLSVKKIKELAEAPRYLNCKISPSELEPIPALSQIWQECLGQTTCSTGFDFKEKLLRGVAKNYRHDTAFKLIRMLHSEGHEFYEIKRKLLEWNKLNKPPIKESWWPDAQIKSTLAYQGKKQFKSPSSQLTALLRNHSFFRTTKLSDAEYRCIITMLSQTNDSEKEWMGVIIKPGQFVCSLPRLGEDARLSGKQKPKTIARNAIRKLIDAGALIRIMQIKKNRGNLYEWQNEFLKIFSKSGCHPILSPPQITPNLSVSDNGSGDYEDFSENLITPIDHLIMSSTKKVVPTQWS